MDEIQEKIKKFAIRGGEFIEFNDLPIGSYISHGNESRVFHDKNGEDVIKLCRHRTEVINDVMTERIIQMTRYQIHNRLFPETQVRILGITQFGDHCFYVIRQKYIESEREATEEEIASGMQKKGFTQLSFRTYSKNGYIVDDVVPKNVMFGKDGNIYVLDATFLPEDENSPIFLILDYLSS